MARFIRHHSHFIAEPKRPEPLSPPSILNSQDSLPNKVSTLDLSSNISFCLWIRDLCGLCELLHLLRQLSVQHEVQFGCSRARLMSKSQPCPLYVRGFASCLSTTLSVTVINYADKSNLKEKGHIESVVQGRDQGSVWSSWSQAQEGKQQMPAPVLRLLSSLHSRTPLPKEWFWQLRWILQSQLT